MDQKDELFVVAGKFSHITTELQLVELAVCSLTGHLSDLTVDTWQAAHKDARGQANYDMGVDIPSHRRYRVRC